MVGCEIIIEPEVKFLIFNTYNSLQYWYNYIKHFFKENKIYANIFDKDRTIVVFNGSILKFIVNNSNSFMQKELRGWHKSQLYYDAEFLLEKDFYKMLKEIING